MDGGAANVPDYRGEILDLSRFSTVRLCHRPTPLEPMENLTAALDGPSLYIKRDDCTGLATGGNKTRKLEFLIGEDFLCLTRLKSCSTL